MEVRSEPERHAVAAIARHRGPRPVARQVDLVRKARERFGPEGELARNRAVRIALRPQHLVLPERVVGILHRQRRQRRRPSVPARRIAARKVARQRRHGPAIARDVMQQQQQHVLVVAKREQMRAQRNFGRTDRSRAGPRAASASASSASLTAVTSSGGRAALASMICWRGDAERVGKDGAQTLVAPDQIGQRGFQRGTIEHAGKPQRQRDRVGGAASFQAIEEPQPALRERQRNLGRTRQRNERRTRRLRRVEPLGQPLDGRSFEQAADRDLDIERGADAADQPRRQQRMAAEREEAVVDADAIAPQHLGEQRAQDFLLRRARRAPCARRHEVGHRQRAAIELAVGRQRQPLQHHDRGRHHVVRQALAEMRPQRGGIGIGIRRSHHVGDQPLVAGLVLAHDHRRLRHRRVPRQRGLDLARLDAEAADLHLRVRSPDEVQHAVGAPARQVAGAVHAAPRRAERIGDEPLRRQPGTPPIAARQPGACEIELAGDAGRHRLQPRVQHISPIVGQRTTDRDVRAGWLLLDHESDGVDGGFGRTVMIGDARSTETA